MGKRKWLIVIIIAAAVVLVMALWRPWEHHHEDLSQYLARQKLSRRLFRTLRVKRFRRQRPT